MTAATDSRSASSEPQSRKPYAADANSPQTKRGRLAVTIILSLFCLIYGSAFALLAPSLLVVFAVPIAILGALIIWALPAAPVAPTSWMVGLFWTFLVASVIWPNYLGLAIPGLPWITVARLTGVPMTVIFLVCLSVSSSFRDQLSKILTAAPLLWKTLILFVFIQFYSIALSKNIGLSADKFITAQTSWTAMFFISAYVFAKPGRVERWAVMVWIMAWVVGVIGVYEHHLRHVPWVGHIPKFLQIQDPTVLTLLQPSMRKYSTVYRVQSVFSGSIQLAEYISYVLPFIMHFGMISRKLAVRFAALISLPFLFYVAYITNSRSGMVGFFISSLLFALLWGLMKWRREPKSVIGPFVVLIYPAVGTLALAAVLLVGRIHALVLGSGAQQASTDARVDQYHHGIPMVIKNPFGHGIGMAAETLGWYTSGGTLTIDTYYLGVALEFGILGFIVYYGMFIIAIITAGRQIVFGAHPEREISFLSPIAIALVNFVVIKGVFYQQDNHALVYMMLGMVTALVYRAKAHQRATANPPMVRASISGKDYPASQAGGPRLSARPSHQPSRP